MEENLELLNELYKNSKMGEETIQTLLPSVEDQKLKADLEKQRDVYLDICQKSRQEISKRNAHPEKISAMTKMSANMGVKMNTLIDKSSSHIADMMIQGSTMGIVSATEGLNNHPNADKPVTDLAKDIVRFEQDNIERMKRYL